MSNSGKVAPKPKKPGTLYSASWLLEATKDIVTFKESEYQTRALEPRTIDGFLRWLGEMLPKAMSRVPHRPMED